VHIKKRGKEATDASHEKDETAEIAQNLGQNTKKNGGEKFKRTHEIELWLRAIRSGTSIPEEGESVQPGRAEKGGSPMKSGYNERGKSLQLNRQKRARGAIEKKDQTGMPRFGRTESSKP